MGRPCLYTDEILAEIVARLSGGEPLAQICRDEGMPAYRTVWQWYNPPKDASDEIKGRAEAIGKAIAHAREEGEDVIASNTRNIARGLTGSTGDVQRDKLVIDTDLKLLAKWNPKKYGDKIDLNHGGQPEGVPMQSKVVVEFVAASHDKTNSDT